GRIDGRERTWQEVSARIGKQPTCAVGGCGSISDGRHLLRRLEALEEGRGSHGREELPFQLGRGDALLLRQAIEELRDTFRGRRPTSTESTVTPVPVVVSASPRAITTAVFPSSPRSIVWPLDSRTGAAHPRPRLARPEGPCWDLGCAALNAGGDDSIPDVRYHPRHDHPLAPRETCVLILSHP